METISSNRDIQKLFIGKKINSISRIAYYHNNSWGNDSLIQFLLSDGSFVLLSGMSDGETLKVEKYPWKDPFSGNIDKETQEFITKHGKWVLHDITLDKNFHRFIGKTIYETYGLFDQNGKPRGITIEIDNHLLSYIYGGDEGRIYVSPEE